MSNYSAVRELLAKVSGQDNTFTIPRIYVEYTGDLTTAVLLNQIVFYSDKSKRTDGYFYKTYKEWEEDICLTERQIRYSINKLKKKEIIETKLMKANGSPTVHYKLLFDKFVDSILTFCQNPIEQIVSIQPDNLSESLTENTTEITTENIYTLFEYWNSKRIIVHKNLNGAMKSNMNARLEDYTIDELKQAIDNFNEILTNDDYYWSHRWTLQDFMKPNNVIKFLPSSKPFETYLSNKNKKYVSSIPSNEESRTDRNVVSQISGGLFDEEWE